MGGNPLVAAFRDRQGISPGREAVPSWPGFRRESVRRGRRVAPRSGMIFSANPENPGGGDIFKGVCLCWII